MHRNASVDVHQFAMIPGAEIPRSSFRIQKALKTTFDAGYLVPIFCEEVLPGDSFIVRGTLFARLSTPLFPVMDNLHLDSFWFFCPNRLVWDNFKKFMGEQANPADSISYVIPQVVTPAGGYAVNSLQDYFGLPTVGQVAGGNTVSHSTLPLRMYNLIWNEWFRDENLQNSVVVDKDDGPDLYSDYVLLRRGKRHDYFTGALPWPLKGGVSVSVPLGTTAPVIPTGDGIPSWLINGAGRNLIGGAVSPRADWSGAVTAGANAVWQNTKLVADLATATAATINQLRQSFQLQRLLERDARGGTRYTEIIRAHFGVISPDARLQRPEYLGGGSTLVNVSPVPQTSATGLTGGATPTGSLAAIGTAVSSGHAFSQSFTEHGYVVGMVSVRADLTYQQGLRRHWSRSTKQDFYWPAFAHLGEQAILNKEIYVRGDANDALVFGYQERWSELKYMPSEVTGLFRSTSAGTIDPWHLAQKFTALPTLNTTFIQDTPPVERVVAVGAAANGKQFIMDCFFDITAVRPLPVFSVPGMIDHF